MDQQTLQEYNKNGFLLLRNFFPKEEINQILTDAKSVFIEQFVAHSFSQNREEMAKDDALFNSYLYRLFTEDMEAVVNCGKQVQHLISLHRLSLKDKVVELLNSAGLKKPVISTRPVLYFNHPNLAKEKVYYKVDSHQDWRSMQGSLNSVVIWAPLIDINKDLGALEILPGSHLFGLRTDHIHSGFGMVELDKNEQNEMTSVEVNVGDALLFSSFLIHQSGENITDRPRWSCHFRYNDLLDPTFIKRKYAHPYIYKPQEELITPDFPQKADVEKIFAA